ncbi:hypothetical protein CUR178_06907 [Leishmania enriettii]|uniref:40S ribosomal protein S21 n=1 Tax=Leishmania enriettii TaxID=5663 RepID=A0A836HW03_LEIEN|nr:hypothetical protein CUR178_06907 [Leishmania enriettii]
MATIGMFNVEGENVDLYIPRKCHATNTLIEAHDHAAVQISIANVGPNGVINGTTTTLCIAGYLRSQGESDHAINHIAIDRGIVRIKTGKPKRVSKSKSKKPGQRGAGAAGGRPGAQKGARPPAQKGARPPAQKGSRPPAQRGAAPVRAEGLSPAGAEGCRAGSQEPRLERRVEYGKVEKGGGGRGKANRMVCHSRAPPPPLVTSSLSRCSSRCLVPAAPPPASLPFTGLLTHPLFFFCRDGVGLGGREAIFSGRLVTCCAPCFSRFIGQSALLALLTLIQPPALLSHRFPISAAKTLLQLLQVFMRAEMHMRSSFAFLPARRFVHVRMKKEAAAELATGTGVHVGGWRARGPRGHDGDDCEGKMR